MAVGQAQGLNSKTVALYLIVKSGESPVESYKISPGLTVGRKGAQIRLNDPKVSSNHATIQEGPDGFEIVDAGSKNGILHNGNRVDALSLVPGTEFNIGSSLFQVLSVNEGEEEQFTPPKPPKPKGKRWNQILANFLRKSLVQVENKPKKLEPLFPALVLDFLRGPQTETRWILGYGPRKIGRLSVDLPIFEERASETCFEILPTPEGIQIIAVGKEVRLNGKSISSEILKVGDRIQIFETEMEVDFLE